MTRLVDMAVGAVGVLILGKACSLAFEPDLVHRTMLLEDGQIVHIVSEPRRECETLRDAISAHGTTVEVSSPWGITYRVERIWCGDYVPDPPSPPTQPQQPERTELGERA